MPLINRVLHLYLCYNYLPRTGRHSSVTLSDLWAMSKLLDGHLIRFCDIMVTNFKRVTNDSQRHLLRYSRLITCLLQRKGIQFPTTSQRVSSEDFTMRHITKTDWTGDRTTGFTRTTPLFPLPGITLRDHDDSEEDIGEDTDDEEPHYSASPMDVGDDAPPSSPSSPISQLTREFQAFRTEMQDEFRDFRQDVYDQLSGLRCDMHTLMSYYHHHPPPPPPDSSS